MVPSGGQIALERSLIYGHIDTVICGIWETISMCDKRHAATCRCVSTMLQQIATSGMPQHAGVFQHVDVRKRLLGQQQEMLKRVTRSSYARDMRAMRATANAQGPQPRCEKNASVPKLAQSNSPTCSATITSMRACRRCMRICIYIYMCINAPKYARTRMLDNYEKTHAHEKA